LDLSNLDSIAAFEKNFQSDNIKIDILINNAGIGSDLDFDLPEEISFKKTFDVNVIGTTFFTEQMLQYLNIGCKIINISSKKGLHENQVITLSRGSFVVSHAVA
jgi:short-subunit dehydrogenase